MPTRLLSIDLSADAAEKFDAALTGKDDDVCLAVEKIILARLRSGVYDTEYDQAALKRVRLVETDPFEVEVTHLP